MSGTQAQIVWTRAAYPALVEVAGRYHAVITYGDLAALVQEVSGVRTRFDQRQWLGKVLALVVREAHRRGDPPLTSLVVHAQDGRVGVGYQEVLAVAGHAPLASELDREEHAAAARLACYRHFGAVLPADGGTPALAPRLRESLSRRASGRAASGSGRGGAQGVSAAPVRVAAVCPGCFIEFPATGVCDSCGASAR
ncbi:hypothetical protein [Streptomyces sp. NRRL WC-3742]|uniref:hypothetical protein n=1 Tax=Streptomyces sp. NRRL WC-3742 TaxID=1463934 RepID=UPI0005677D47|nr:hypothetical protein [Streptomyces sp. NRRL WC-3742]